MRCPKWASASCQARAWRSTESTSVPSTSKRTASAGIRSNLGSPRADGDEEPAFVSETADPGELGYRPLDRPVVFLLEQRVGLSVEERAGKGAQPGEAVLAQPAAHFAQRVPMLLHVTVLVAQPRLAARRLAAAGGEHRVAGNPAIARESRDGPPRPQRQSGEDV